MDDATERSSDEASAERSRSFLKRRAHIARRRVLSSGVHPSVCEERSGAV